MIQQKLQNELSRKKSFQQYTYSPTILKKMDKTFLQVEVNFLEMFRKLERALQD